MQTFLQNILLFRQQSYPKQKCKSLIMSDLQILSTAKVFRFEKLIYNSSLLFV
jgi:hypothetical protein